MQSERDIGLQRLWRRYALAAPSRVVVDADGVLFASAKRWFVAAPGPKAPPPARSAACRVYDRRRKRFADGTGFYCADAANFGRHFSWRRGDPPVLVADGTAPLLGWHFNGAASRPLLRAALDALPPG